MSESLFVGSTWGRAFLLWFYTNVGGFVGAFISLNLLVAFDHNNHSTGSDIGFIALLVGLFAAVPSLLIVPLIYVSFRWLLPIAGYWPRLLATGALLTGLFMLVAFVAGMSADDDFSLLSILYSGGWAYWVAALGGAAIVYQRELFRPAEADEQSLI